MGKTQDGNQLDQGTPDPGQKTGDGTPKDEGDGTQNEPKTYTESELAQEISKSNAALSQTLSEKYERDIKVVKDKLADNGRLVARAEKAEDKVDELLKLADDPDLTAAERRKLIEEIDEATNTRDKLKDEIAELQKIKGSLESEQKVVETAKKYGIEEKDIEAFRSYCKENTKLDPSECPDGVLHWVATRFAEDEAAKGDNPNYKSDSGEGRGQAPFDAKTASPQDKMAEQRRREKGKIQVGTKGIKDE